MLFLSHCFKGASYLCDFTVNTDLGVLAKVVFVKCLCCKVIFFYYTFHLVLSGGKAVHTSGAGVMLHLLKGRSRVSAYVLWNTSAQEIYLPSPI